MVEMPAARAVELLGGPDGEPSAAVAERVARARAAQTARQGRPNALLGAAQAGAGPLGVDDAAGAFLQTVAARLHWSGRAVHRALRVARTIADLAGAERIATAHVAEAVQYRRALDALGGAGP